ncbi:unnamed protein product [Arctogadus glacialis]
MTEAAVAASGLEGMVRMEGMEEVVVEGEDRGGPYAGMEDALGNTLCVADPKWPPQPPCQGICARMAGEFQHGKEKTGCFKAQMPNHKPPESTLTAE